MLPAIKRSQAATKSTTQFYANGTYERIRQALINSIAVALLSLNGAVIKGRILSEVPTGRHRLHARQELISVWG